MLGVDEASQLLSGTAANAWQVARGRLKSYPGLGILVERFYRSIEGAGPVPVDGAAGREVVRVLDQVWEQIGPSPASLARGGSAR